MRFRQVVLGAVIAVQMMTVGAMAQQSAPELTMPDVPAFLRENDEMAVRFENMIRGMATVNVYLRNQGKAELYCSPITMTLDQHIVMLEAYLEENPKLKEQGAGQASYIMLMALVDAFPCS